MLKKLQKAFISLSTENAKQENDDDEEKIRKRREESEKILSQFRALSVVEQEQQRKVWNEELKLVKPVLVVVPSHYLVADFIHATRS